MLEQHVENISTSHSVYAPQVDSFLEQYDDV